MQTASPLPDWLGLEFLRDLVAPGQVLWLTGGSKEKKTVVVTGR